MEGGDGVDQVRLHRWHKDGYASRGMMVESAQFTKDGKEWRALVHKKIIKFNLAIFLLGPLFFWTALPCSGGLSPGEGWDVIMIYGWVNCKMGAATENQVAGAWDMG